MSLNKSKYFILFLFFGLLIFCYPMLMSNFDLVPGEGLDIKVFTYILEHSRLWLLQAPTHEHFWSAPFFYPNQNTLAYSDTAMGIMPLYWLLRCFLKPFCAVQILMVLMCILNYSTFYYMLKELKFSSLSSSFGAFIFAFSLLRWFRMQHLNYYTQFYTILCLIFLIKLIQQKDISKLKTHVYFALASIFLVVQFYSCYTLAYYFCITGFFGIFLSILFKDTRPFVFDFFKRYLKYIILYSALSVLFLIPYAKIYLSVGIIRSIESVQYYAQTPLAWLRSVSFADLFINEHFDFVERAGFESCASIGILTTFAALFGVRYLNRAKYIVFILLFAIFIFSCDFYGILPYRIIYPLLFGAQGIRVIIRISFISLILLSIALGAFIEHFKNSKRIKTGLFILLLAIVIEQIPKTDDINSNWHNYNMSKSAFMAQVEQSIKDIPKDTDVIWFDYDINSPTLEKAKEKGYVPVYISLVDFSPQLYTKWCKITEAIDNLAMWSGLMTNKYVIGGSSGVQAYEVMRYKKQNAYKRIYKANLDTFDLRKYLLNKDYKIKYETESPKSLRQIDSF